MAFLDELAPYGDRVEFWPQDQRGLLDLEHILGTPQADTLVYCCGPQGLLTAVEDRCTAWPAGALRLERFSSSTVETEWVNTPIEVELARHGVTLTVPADQSVLEAIEAARCRRDVLVPVRHVRDLRNTGHRRHSRTPR